MCSLPDPRCVRRHIDIPGFIEDSGDKRFRQQRYQSTAADSLGFDSTNDAIGWLQRFTVDPHFFDRTGCGAHTVDDACAFEGWSRRTCTGDEPITVAQDGFTVR